MYQPRLSIVNHQTHVAVIGCGYWGMNYVRVLSELPDSRVTVVCDERASRLDEVARRFPDVQLTTSIEEALDDDTVEAAVICTQAATHRDIAGRALELGKHVLVEKPFTVDVAEADELIELAERVDRVLLTGHTFLYNGGVRSVKTLMDDGALGDLYYVYARRTNLGPFRADVNALWDLAPHDVAIFNYLLDDTPTWVSAVGARVLRNGREDVGFISLGYPSGLIGHIHVSWADPHKVREFVVVGSDRRVAFNDLDLVERVRVFDRGVKPGGDEPTTYGEHHLQIREGDITSPVVPGTEPLKHLSGHFLHCIRRGERPQTSGRDGREVVAVMQAVQQSLTANGAPVILEASIRAELEPKVAGPVR
jgi:predicted dehydrogenase